jgi:DNA-binding MarR family transcriptional regulator
MLDMIIHALMMINLSMTIEPTTGAVDGRAADASVDEIIEGFAPMMAYQRRSMMRAWQDRSLSKLNLHVLMLLDHHGPLSMTRLATLADVSMSNMTGIVDRLEQHGMVERVRDDRDRRLVLARATPSGASRCEEAEGLRREHLRRVIGTLDGPERAVVLEAAQALARGVARLEASESTEH